MVFNKKVNCWFCNAESNVSFFKTNSWTCSHCSQYNGFKRNGDYNKPINEIIQTEVSNKKYCVTTVQNGSNDNRVILCERCNSHQEKKIEEINKFEPKNENKFDEEFEVYKKKVEEIYDLCINCKNKVKMHLTHLDREIGKHNSNMEATTSNSKNKRISILKPLNNVTNMIIDGCNQIKNGYYNSTTVTKTSFFEKKNCLGKDDIDTKKVFSNKANTIAGTVAPYSFKNVVIAKKSNPLEFSKIGDNSKNGKKIEDILEDVNKEKPKEKNSKSDKNLKPSFFYHIIFADFLIFICILSVFLGDLANLLNDSGQLELNSLSYLVLVYKNANNILNSCIALSTIAFFLRLKLSRFSITIGISILSLIHAQIITLQNLEEHYVLELISSFFLTTFLLIARLYNLMQGIAYIKNKTLNKVNESLNQSIILNATLNNDLSRVGRNSETQRSQMVPLNDSKIKASNENTPQNLRTRLLLAKSPNDILNIEDSPMQVDMSLNEDSSIRLSNKNKVQTNLFQTTYY